MYKRRAAGIFHSAVSELFKEICSKRTSEKTEMNLAVEEDAVRTDGSSSSPLLRRRQSTCCS
ncbi:hypothetical protein EYF80_015054 [Liparis tanakae]|uniref:Uncharacterized protein n=1 Tax=Liparis tanakae TaxID=230148 RepID=A0A4Z2I9N7_9TELE|nr:hypothetical protein EYF80_015054 [Liparis tanakae]